MKKKGLKDPSIFARGSSEGLGKELYIENGAI